MARKQVKKEPEDPPVPCAYMGCHERAFVRVRVAANAWSNFCSRHYLEYHQRRSEETCERLELKTTVEQRAYVRDVMRKLQEKLRERVV